MRTVTTIRLLPAFLAALGLAVVIGFAVFAVVVGLSAAVHWVYIYLSPVVVIGVIVGLFWLLARGIERLPEPPNRDWKQ